MDRPAGVVIVGAGLAGAHAAIALRDYGYEGSITLLGRERWAPYDRPPLSKAYLKGGMAPEKLSLWPLQTYAERDIGLRLGVEVQSFERYERRVLLDSGERLRYDALILATGGEARRLAASGDHLEGVHTLKTVDDTDALSRQLQPGRAVVVIGGGFVGMEFAATARQAGCEVTVLEAQQRILARSLSAVVGRHLEQVHSAHGVQLLTGAEVSRLEGDGRVTAVITADGARLAADLVLVSVGNEPGVELARAAGLQAERGIVVDADGRTADANVFAVGDCATCRREGFEAPVRLESVQHAIAQARRAAAAIAGKPAPDDEIPWFWSDQYDLKLQMAGLPLPGDEEILRGDPETGRFSVIFQNAGRMTAIHCVNASGDFAGSKRMIAMRRTFPVDLLKNAQLSLREIRTAVVPAG